MERPLRFARSMHHESVISARWEPRAIAASIASFVLLAAAAIAAYPGGHSWNTHAPGHDFWRNFLCDLARAIALDGTPNPVGSTLGRAAMLVIGAGLLPFFRHVTRLAHGAPRLGLGARAAGAIAVIAVPAVVFVSGDRYGKLHAVAVVAAGVPGLLACGAAALALQVDRGAPRAVAWAGALALLAAAVDFTLYVASLGSPGPGPVLVAVLERVANVGLLVWMGLAAGARREAAVCAGSPEAAGLDSRPEAA